MPRQRRGMRKPRVSRPKRRLGGARKLRPRRGTKGVPKRQLIQANLGGLSMTRFNAARAPNSVARHIKHTGAPNFINITYPGIVRGKGGLQAYSSWYLNCRNDLQRIWASIQGLQIVKNSTTGVNYADNVPGGSYTVNPTFRYVLESAVSMLHLANTCATPLNVELYDVVAKRDSGQVGYDLSGNTFVNNLSTGNQFLDPSIAWFYGCQQVQGNTSGFKSAPGYQLELVDPTNLGSTPYNSKLFKDFFKVVRKTNLSIPIGGQHKHYVDLKPNAIIDNDFMSQNAVYKGLSFFTLVVVSGVPVVKCPDELSVGDLGDVTTSAPSLSVIQNVKYKWTWVEDSRENIYRANFINTSNVNSAKTVQPAMSFVAYADDGQQEIFTTGNDLVSGFFPSQCTRVDIPIEGKATDCAC